jgi:PRC-barrel domain protein
MPQARLFRLEAEVRCADGDCGKLRTLVIRRRDDAVTHLVVESAHRDGPVKIVPLGLVDTGLVDTGGAGTAKGEVRLRCTTAEFERLDSAEATYFPGDEDYENTVGRWEPDDLWPYYASASGMVPGAPGSPGGPGTIPKPVTVDAVPDELPGEDEVFRGEHVHATDGDIGQVLGFVVEAGSGRVTSVLLREGHLLGRKAVLIPRSAVAEVGADGFRLNITREQVRHLPPADIEHPPAG